MLLSPSFGVEVAVGIMGMGGGIGVEVGLGVKVGAAVKVGSGGALGLGIITAGEVKKLQAPIMNIMGNKIRIIPQPLTRFLLSTAYKTNYPLFPSKVNAGSKSEPLIKNTIPQRFLNKKSDYLPGNKRQSCPCWRHRD